MMNDLHDIEPDEPGSGSSYNEAGNEIAPSRWETIYRRLEIVQQRIEHSAALTREGRRAILRARAKRMAQEPVYAMKSTTELEIVQFRMAHETYGFETRYVREIYPLKDYCPLPCTPGFVFGLVNVRGQLLSVLDLKKFFGLFTQELDSHHRIIILRNGVSAGSAPHEGAIHSGANHSGGMEIGILADGLLDVRRLAPEHLQPALPTLTGFRYEFLLGITPERVIVLDAEKLLSSPDIIVYEEVDT